MNWDVRIKCFSFQDGDDGLFPRAILERAFEGISERSMPEAWRLHGCDGTISSREEPEINGFSVHRPPGPDHPFWPALVEVLRQTNTVLCWPAAGCVAVNPSVIPHIPEEWDRDIGMPIFTADVAEIYAIMEKALAKELAHMEGLFKSFDKFVK